MKGRFSILLLLAALTWLRLPAQGISLDGLKVQSAATAETGFYVLSRAEREENYAQRITTYYTPQLVYLDADLEPQWSVDFAEYYLPTMDYLAVIGERIYVSGTHYPDGGERAIGWLVCLTLDGEALWEHTLALEGHHSVEGHRVYPGPDGDLIWVAHSFRNYNSYEHPVVARLRPEDGSEVWRRSYAVASVSSMMLHSTLLADGNLAFTGSDFQTRAEFGDGLYSGAVWKVNGEDGSLLWEQRPRMQAQTHWTGVQPLADGGLVLAGWAGAMDIPAQPIVARLDSRGTVVQQDFLRQFSGAMMYEFWPVENGYCLVGRQGENEGMGDEGKTLILRLDGNLRVVGQAAHAPGQYMDYLATEGGLLAFGREAAYAWDLPAARTATAPTSPGTGGSGMQGVGRPQMWIGGARR